MFVISEAINRVGRKSCLEVHDDMKISTNHLKRLIKESLTGRNLERVAKRIVYDIFEYLVDEDIKNAFASQGKIGFVVETTLPESLTWLDRVIVRMHPSQGFNSSARYEYDIDATDDQRKDSDLIVDLFLPVDYTIQEISRFRYEIEADVRHELEHSGQETSDLMSTQKVIQAEEDIWKSLDNALAYYAAKIEIPAYSAGWVLKAKRTRQNIYDIIYQELYRIYATGLDAGYSEDDMTKFMSNLSEIYYTYIGDRWPQIMSEK